jgi:hypothetical protein
MTIVQWIIAAGTTIFVALVGYFQWRTAQQKAVLDLFERRHAIYEVVRKAVGTMISNSNDFDQGREIEFLQSMERAYFFFGDDVVTYLDQLWSAIGDIRDADKEMKDIGDSAARGAVLQRRRAAVNRVGKFHNEGKPLFGRYMRFSQTMPTTERLEGLWLRRWSTALKRFSKGKGDS